MTNQETLKTADYYLNLNPAGDLFSKYLDTDNYDYLLDDDDIADTLATSNETIIQ